MPASCGASNHRQSRRRPRRPGCVAGLTNESEDLSTLSPQYCRRGASAVPTIQRRRSSSSPGAGSALACAASTMSSATSEHHAAACPSSGGAVPMLRTCGPRSLGVRSLAARRDAPLARAARVRLTRDLSSLPLSWRASGYADSAFGWARYPRSASLLAPNRHSV